MFYKNEKRKHILVVEPNEKVRRILTDFLCSNYVCFEAEGVGDAFEKLSEKEFDVFVSNYDLGETNGLELISSLQFLAPTSPVILLGNQKTSAEIIKSFRIGAFDFIEKPFELRELEDAVERAVSHNANAENISGNNIENVISDKNRKIDNALEEVENAYQTTITALVQALETRDYETFGHSERVVTFSLRLGHEIGIEEEAMRDLELGSLLHDIGKIGVPDSILRKPAKLNRQEWNKMKLHPLHGHRILRNIPFLKGAARIVLEHHERWDGKGYPNKLRGNEIYLGARIFAVADAFDAIISDRVYRRGRSYSEALNELERCAGTQFDPMVVEVFKSVPEEDWQVLRERSLKTKQENFSFREIVAELVQAEKFYEMIH